MDALPFVRAMTYLQPYAFPIDIMVAMLHSVPFRTWAKLYVFARTFFPQETTMITLLENYNLWDVRIPMTRLDTCQHISKCCPQCTLPMLPCNG